VSSNSFDERAATWDEDPKKRQRADGVAESIRTAVALRPDMRLLEYGAGTGLVSQALRDHVGPITLADSSQGMLDVLRAKVADGVLPDARVLDLDLSRDPALDERFDLIVTVMTLHHIPDLDPVLDGFAAMLEDGGHLCVVDLEREDGSFHGHGFPGHEGFDRDPLAERLRKSGFGDIRFQHAYKMEKSEHSFDLFLMTCVRGDR